MMAESWVKWAIFEALAKAAATTLHKITGIISASIGHLLFATAAAGFVQAIIGFVLAKTRKKSIAADGVGIAGSALFGFFAVVSGVLVMSAYLYGGEVGVVVFITTLSIVPGALIDRIFFWLRIKRSSVVWNRDCGYGRLFHSWFAVFDRGAPSAFVGMVGFRNDDELSNQSGNYAVHKSDRSVCKKFLGRADKICFCRSRDPCFLSV